MQALSKTIQLLGLLFRVALPQDTQKKFASLVPVEGLTEDLHSSADPRNHLCSLVLALPKFAKSFLSADLESPEHFRDHLFGRQHISNFV